MIPFVLLFLGLLSVFIEFFLPGAVFGFIGAVLIVMSIVMYAGETTSVLSLVMYIILALGLFGLVIKLALISVRKNKSLFSNADQAGYVATSYDATAIGERGVVASDLKPAGYIMIQGKKLQARSASGYIVAGSTVEVIGGEEDALIVKLVDTKGE